MTQLEVATKANPELVAAFLGGGVKVIIALIRTLPGGPFA